MKEYELYKSIYCGLCRSMKKHTGGISRVTLSYDMTFFALIRMVLSETDFGIRKHRCMAHPAKKRPMMDDNAELEYTAYVSALLIAHKVDDTIADEHGVKKLGAKMARPYVNTMKRYVSRSEYEIADIVAKAMEEIRRLEKECCASPDMLADIFGKMLGTLLAIGLDEKKKKIAYEIGLHTGRWVYLMDAVCDYEDDRKNGSYNPFLYAFTDTEQMQNFKNNALCGVMTLESDAILRAADFLDFEGKSMFRACMENIIIDGMGSALSLAVGKEEIHGK